MSEQLKAQIEKAEKAEQALESVNASAGTARTLFLGFMFLTGYIAVVLASTNDLQLLLYTPINLPFFNIEIDIKGFYTFMPWLYLIVHANLLLIFSFLTDKVNNLEASLQPLTFQERQSFLKRLHILIFVQYLSKQHKGFLKVFVGVITWMTIVFIPLLLLLWIQLDFLPAQEETIIWWQRATVFFDYLLIRYFWNTNLQKRRRSLLPENWELPSWRRYTMSGLLLSVLSTLCLLASFFIVVVPFSPWDKTITGNSPEDVSRIKQFRKFYTEKEENKEGQNSKKAKYDYAGNLWQINLNKFRGWFFVAVFNFKPWMELNEEIITKNALGAETLSRLNKLKHSIHLNELRQENENNLTMIKNRIIGIDLQNRNLRFAQLSKAVLINADLRKASLQGVNLEQAQLQYVNLKATPLQYVNLKGAKLQGANLLSAKLQGANLRHAKLQDANLSFAKLLGADLSFAKLQGANLLNAKLQGADLLSAKLQGTFLWDAKLQGANLKYARLQGAYIRDAKLQGANLKYAKLQGAYLLNAKLQGTNFLNASVDLASIYFSSTAWNKKDKNKTVLSIWNSTLEKQNKEKIISRIEKAWQDQTIKGNFFNSELCVYSTATSTIPKIFKDICVNFKQINAKEVHEYYKKRAELRIDIACEYPVIFKHSHFYFLRIFNGEEPPNPDNSPEEFYSFNALEKIFNDNKNFSCKGKTKLSTLWKELSVGVIQKMQNGYNKLSKSI